MARAEATSAVPAKRIKDWRLDESDGLNPILRAALNAIVEVGFHGTTIRQIAEGSGLSVPGIYHHYRSKHELLVSIMEYAMEDLWERTRLAVEEAKGVTQREFELYVECMVLFHASHPALASTSQNEIRSLSVSARKKHVQKRDRQHRALEEIVGRGCEEGIFGTIYPRQATTAIITMCTGIAHWFRATGDLTPAELATRYRSFAIRLVS